MKGVAEMFITLSIIVWTIAAHIWFFDRLFTTDQTPIVRGIILLNYDLLMVSIILTGYSKEKEKEEKEKESELKE